MAAGLLIVPNYFPAVDTNGRPVSGALFYVYVNRTTTPATIYSDSGLTTPLTNPVVANASGVFALVYVDQADAFTVALTGPTGTLLKPTYDDIFPTGSTGYVSQTITNGVTDRAPSENAVYDALALKPDGITLGTVVKLGILAGDSSTGTYLTALGYAAGISYSGNFSTLVGATAGEGAAGDRNQIVGPIAKRYGVGSSWSVIGFAAGENVDGDRHNFWGDHAGAPPYTDRLMTGLSMNAATNILTSDPPVYDGSPIALEVGKTYRLQFENGGGTAPLPLASSSTLATCQTIGATITWLVTSADVTTNGTGAYLCGLCHYHWDDLISMGSGAPDGPNQTWIGWENTREQLPPNDGLTAMGRSVALATAYGTRGPYRYRDVVSRQFSVAAFAGEAPVIDFSVGNYVRSSVSVEAATGDLQFTARDATGTAIGNPLILTATGWVKPRVVDAANDAAAAGAGVPVGGMYRNGSVAMIRVA